jgi:murein DD-endopeptidase MepM/ murein hydrolase activator NlpD
MRLLYIENHQRIYRFVSRTMKHKLLNFSLLLCLLLSSCTAIKEAVNRSQTHKKGNQETVLNLAESDQISPIKGKVISPFGYRGRHNHTGTDIKLHKGDSVRAAFCGRVTKASPYSGYGNLVILKHINNIETYYAHLSKCLVHVGDTVTAGEVIGLGGRTGRATTDHLHFEVRINKSPKDPEHFFDFSAGKTKILFLAYNPSVKIKYDPIVKVEQDTKIVKETSLDNVVSIQKGETLYSLARRHNTTVKQLQELNNLQSSNLKIGMKLKIR